MNKKKSIVLVEDQTIVRDGLKALLSSHDGLQVIGEAEDGRRAIQRARELKPDLMLMDLSMPGMNGIEAIREIKRESPETKVLVLTVHKTEEYVHATLEAGADGYVSKDTTYLGLVMAITSVLDRKRYLSPEISEKMIDGYLEGKKALRTGSTWEALTHREREVLKLVAEGYKNKEIADYLYISIKTVEKHRENLMKKLDLHNTAALTDYAWQRGIVSK